MSRDAYLTAVSETLCKSSYAHTPREGKRQQVSFIVGGGVHGATDFDSWTVGMQDKEKAARLYLFNKGDLYAVCSLDKTGAWLGRERVTNGKIAFIGSVSLVDTWVKLDSYSRFLAEWPKQKALPIINPFEYDIRKHGDRGEGNTAIALIGCDRPEYFRRVCATIAQNFKTKAYPVYVFLDKCKDVEISFEQALIANELLPDARVIIREISFGCGRNIIDARRQLFDNLEYDYVFVMEDDTVISPNYLQLMKNLMTWGEKHYSDIGVVQGWNFCQLPKAVKSQLLNKVKVTYNNWWAYLMARRAWDRMKDLIYDYENTFLDVANYDDRDHAKIRAYLGYLIRTENTVTRPAYGFPLHDNAVTELCQYAAKLPAGQDAATMVACLLSGYRRITTLVNRAAYIGASGIHMDRDRFIREGYDTVELDEFEGDAELSIFSPFVSSETGLEFIDTTKE